LWKEARSFKNTEHASIFGFNWNESVQYGSNGEWVVGRVGMHEFRKAQDVALQIRKNRSQKKLSNYLLIKLMSPTPRAGGILGKKCGTGSW
jgi:hypothetical protein